MKIKTMKVMFSILLISTVLFSVTACSRKNGEETEPQVTSGDKTTVPESTEAPTTATPTTEPRSFTAVQPGEIPVDSDAVYASRGEGNSWQKYIYSFGTRNTGKQHVSFDVTPLEDNIDASVDFADAEVDVRGFENLALMVRFSTGGGFGIQSGAAFETIVPYSYTANTIYHVDIYADMNAKNRRIYYGT